MVDSTPITRKKFATTILKGLAATTVLGALPFIKFQKGNIRIRPIPGKEYSPTFLAFCEKARFKSVKHALMCVRNRKIEFLIEYANDVA